MRLPITVKVNHISRVLKTLLMAIKPLKLDESPNDIKIVINPILSNPIRGSMISFVRRALRENQNRTIQVRRSE